MGYTFHLAICSFCKSVWQMHEERLTRRAIKVLAPKVDAPEEDPARAPPITCGEVKAWMRKFFRKLSTGKPAQWWWRMLPCMGNSNQLKRIQVLTQFEDALNQRDTFRLQKLADDLKIDEPLPVEGLEYELENKLGCLGDGGDLIITQADEVADFVIETHHPLPVPPMESTP